jgi:hypothetical protein
MLLDNDKTADAADVAQRLEDALERSSDFPFLSATVAHANALVHRDAALAETAASLYDGCPQRLCVLSRWRMPVRCCLQIEPQTPSSI